MKKTKTLQTAIGLLLLLLLSLSVQAQHTASNKKHSKPLIPIGWDAYRQWHRWPLQRPGVRAYMRSTHDRRGSIDDTGHFLFMNEENDNVTLDVKGKGMLCFFRTNHWHGSPWHFSIDGSRHTVKETATDNPVDAKKNFSNTSFNPAGPFPKPFGFTWSTTRGADLLWTPMPFRNDLRIAYSRTHYGTGYYIYQLFANEEDLSQPIISFKPDQAPAQDLVDLVNRAGTDIAPLDIQQQHGKIILNNNNIRFAHIRSSSSVIRAVKFWLPMEKGLDLERVRLRITWDNATHPSVEAPLCLFFGTGTLYNRDNREYLVKGFPINIRFDQTNKKIELACYYPMPFQRTATFELTGTDHTDTEIDYEIRYERDKTPFRHNSYFHATYKDIPDPETGQDMTWLDTKGIEGHANWSGSFVGTSFIFSHDAVLHTLEGDPRFFFDDSQTPQGHGTGTEEWGGGGDYWGGENMTLPLAGHPCGAPDKKSAQHPKDMIESAYRFLLADLMPFGRRAVIRFEHGENITSQHYEAVTYWYGLPAPSLVKTDSLDIGNLSSERLHTYSSPQASAVDTILSRYEWGIDSLSYNTWGIRADKLKGYKAGAEVYPAHRQDGRFTNGTTEFTIALAPNNNGALLRRTLDYSFPNQTALVYIADASGPSPNWQPAGTWYTAGSNTCVFSRAKGELDKRFYDVQTSNRRFRDDEFLIPAALTKGRTAVRVRIQFVPVQQELYPGYPFPKAGAWSELKYDVYSYVTPNLQQTNSN